MLRGSVVIAQARGMKRVIMSDIHLVYTRAGVRIALVRYSRDLAQRVVEVRVACG
jgi:hypothetical protein